MIFVYPAVISDRIDERYVHGIVKTLENYYMLHITQALQTGHLKIAIEEKVDIFNSNRVERGNFFLEQDIILSGKKYNILLERSLSNTLIDGGEDWNRLVEVSTILRSIANELPRIPPSRRFDFERVHANAIKDIKDTFNNQNIQFVLRNLVPPINEEFLTSFIAVLEVILNAIETIHLFYTRIPDNIQKDIHFFFNKPEYNEILQNIQTTISTVKDLLRQQNTQETEKQSNENTREKINENFKNILQTRPQLPVNLEHLNIDQLITLIRDLINYRNEVANYITDQNLRRSVEQELKSISNDLDKIKEAYKKSLKEKKVFDPKYENPYFYDFSNKDLLQQNLDILASYIKDATEKVNLLYTIITNVSNNNIDQIVTSINQGFYQEQRNYLDHLIEVQKVLLARFNQLTKYKEIYIRTLEIERIINDVNKEIDINKIETLEELKTELQNFQNTLVSVTPDIDLIKQHVTGQDNTIVQVQKLVDAVYEKLKEILEKLYQLKRTTISNLTYEDLIKITPSQFEKDVVGQVNINKTIEEVNEAINSIKKELRENLRLSKQDRQELQNRLQQLDKVLKQLIERKKEIDFALENNNLDYYNTNLKFDIENEFKVYNSVEDIDKVLDKYNDLNNIIKNLEQLSQKSDVTEDIKDKINDTIENIKNIQQNIVLRKLEDLRKLRINLVKSYEDRFNEIKRVNLGLEAVEPLNRLLDDIKNKLSALEQSTEKTDIEIVKHLRKLSEAITNEIHIRKDNISATVKDYENKYIHLIKNTHGENLKNLLIELRNNVETEKVKLIRLNDPRIQNDINDLDKLIKKIDNKLSQLQKLDVEVFRNLDQALKNASVKKEDRKLAIQNVIIRIDEEIKKLEDTRNPIVQPDIESLKALKKEAQRQLEKATEYENLKQAMSRPRASFSITTTDEFNILPTMNNTVRVDVKIYKADGSVKYEEMNIPIGVKVMTIQMSKHSDIFKVLTDDVYRNYIVSHFIAAGRFFMRKFIKLPIINQIYRWYRKFKSGFNREYTDAYFDVLLRDKKYINASSFKTKESRSKAYQFYAASIVILSEDDIREEDQNFFKDPWKVNILFRMGWNSFVIMNDRIQKLIFCSNLEKGMCAKVPYAYLFRGGAEKVFTKLETMKTYAGKIMSHFRSVPYRKIKDLIS